MLYFAIVDMVVPDKKQFAEAYLRFTYQTDLVIYRFVDLYFQMLVTGQLPKHASGQLPKNAVKPSVENDLGVVVHLVAHEQLDKLARHLSPLLLHHHLRLRYRNVVYLHRNGAQRRQHRLIYQPRPIVDLDHLR